jgi:Beta-galactosidase
VIRAALVMAAALAVAAAPAAAGWDRYEVILWHAQEATPEALAAAKTSGVTAGMVFGARAGDAEAALQAQAAKLRVAGLPFYVENIATDFYSPYHFWRPDRAVSWAFDVLQARHRADPADDSVFRREPSLSDPAWLARIAARLAEHVRVLGPDRPLFYNLGDETGIADLTAPWDFDRSPVSLAGFREWLRGEYGSLDALNREWGTGFAEWDAVVPLTTDAALALTDGNFSAWADFRAWMDVAFARAIRAGSDALHAADPAARAAIEGAQEPGTGGYDYTKLAPAVDVMEVTGWQPAFAIAHALNPALVLLTTIGQGNPETRHAIWRALLAGGRGVVLWEFDPALAPLFAELRGPVGDAVLAATPRYDPVAILYSPASLRTQWVLDRQADAAAGQKWSERRADSELEPTAPRVALRQAQDALAHLGLEPRFLSPALLAGDGLRGTKVLILPHAIALSDAEISAIRGFAAGGGTVLADIPPGGFDAHSRRRAAPLTQDITLLPGFFRPALAAALATAGVVPEFTIVPPADDVTVRVLRHGDATILGIQRDFSGAAVATDITLALPALRRIRDLRTGETATTDRLALRLDPIAPSILAIEAP